MPELASEAATQMFLVLLLNYAGRAQNCFKLWIDAGLASTNSRRFINIAQLVGALESDVLEALPGLHAFTGSDFTAAFMNKGKQRPFELMMKSKAFVRAFGKMGQEQNLSSDIFRDLEASVCALYGKLHMKSVNTVRFAMFQQHYAPKKDGDPL